MVDPAQGVGDVTGALEEARATDAVVLVDDAHLVPEPVLALLARAAREGAPVRLSRRPTIAGAALGDLDAAAARHGVVELGPLAEAEVAALLARAGGRPVDPERAAEVRRTTAGLPALVAAFASDDPEARVRARVARQLARTADPRTATRVVAVLAIAPEVADDVLADAVGVDRTTLAATVRDLREAGLLVPDGERLIPVVADAVTAQLAPAERRETHLRVAAAMAAGDDPLPVAEQLREGRVRTDHAARAYVAAGERLRFADPAAASGWYELAVLTGADPSRVAAGLAECALLLGRHADIEAPVDPADAGRMAVVAGVAAAQQGRAGRAADALLAAPAPGPVLAVPSLVAVGRFEEARSAAQGDGPQVARLLAEAALALGDPAAALPPLIEAAEAFEAAPGLLLPDTPHAIAATAAVAAGDTATAEDLLARACDRRVGGPHAELRHRLLFAWVRLRAGRPEPADDALAGLDVATLPGRERLLVAAVVAGRARRSGEASQLRKAWAVARPALVRRSVDLLAAEASEELLVAAARLREPDPVAATLHDLEGIVDRLGGPDTWRRLVGWSRLQVAVATDDPVAAAAAAEGLGGAVPSRAKQRAQAVAATAWAAALEGKVDGDATDAAASDLAAAGLPWEASRLCGHAAIRTGSADVARRLLERARELSETGHAAEAARAAGAAGLLSEREIEVARLVLAGETYRAIGGQLYLSPKTVEHHVARIKSKLGASSRADLIAALGTLLARDVSATP